MSRFRLAVLLAALVSVVAAVPVSAQGKPTREPYPVEAFTLAAGDACTFSLLVEPLAANEYILTFPERPDGTVRQHISGRLVTRFTNLLTGESVTYNVSGPATIVNYPDGSFTTTNYGSSFAWLTPAEGGPAAWVQHGRLVWQVDAPDFLFRVVEQRGRTTDVCAALS